MTEDLFADFMRKRGGSARDNADDELQMLQKEYTGRIVQMKAMTIDELVNYHAVWYSSRETDTHKRAIYEDLCKAVVVELKKRMKKPRAKKVVTK